ncbi:MAG: lipid-A-disaccharide synthase [Alistipes sp.]|nr:lipid-A-disaccharide synthase [Alistipes sp.]
MRYYLIAGEASGDLHGANLMAGIRKADPDARFRFWGGDRMADVGGAENLARRYKTASFFGLVEVVRNLPEIFRQIRECKRDIDSYRPDAVILIDYSGFNFRMAKYAHGKGYPVFYYISPKVWAWKESRVEKIRKYVDRLFIIFPFEVDYFTRKGIDAIFEGNPLADVVAAERAALPGRGDFLARYGIPDDKPLVALLAGSRRSEIEYNLPFMAALSQRFPGHRFVVAGVDWLDRRLYDRVLEGTGVGFVSGATYPLLAYSEAAVVCSGTATLETALMNVPEVVCYRKDALSVFIGRFLVKIRFISLVNLIMDREVVRELIQQDMTLDNAAEELRALLPGGRKREKMLGDFAELARLVGGSGASERFGARMVSELTAIRGMPE